MFYANYIKFCGKMGKSPSAVAVELGFKKSTVTRWKQGGDPTDYTVQRVADYFGIDISELVGDEKKPAPDSGDELSSEVIKLAKAIDLLPEQYREELWKKVRAAQEFCKDM